MALSEFLPLRAKILAVISVAARRGRKLNASSINYLVYLLRTTITEDKSKLSDYYKFDIAYQTELSHHLLQLELKGYLTRDIATDGEARYIVTAAGKELVMAWSSKYNTAMLDALEHIFKELSTEKALRTAFLNRLQEGVAI